MITLKLQKIIKDKKTAREVSGLAHRYCLLFQNFLPREVKRFHMFKAVIKARSLVCQISRNFKGVKSNINTIVNLVTSTKGT